MDEKVEDADFRELTPEEHLDMLNVITDPEFNIRAVALGLQTYSEDGTEIGRELEYRIRLKKKGE